MPKNLNEGDQESQQEQDEATEESQAQATSEASGDAEADDTNAGGSEEEPGQESSVETPDGEESTTSGLYEGIPEEHPIRSELTSVRAEAASRRNENRALQSTIDDLREQLGKAKTQEEFDQAIADYDQRVNAATLEATRERVGRTYGLPDELVSRLQGDTEEELAADAQALQGLMGTKRQAPPQNPPSGGLNPNEERFDAKSVAARLRKSRGVGLGR